MAGGGSHGWPDELCERAEALINTICPKSDTNKRRDGVQQYVKGLITRCFYPEQARGTKSGRIHSAIRPTALD